MTGRLPRLMLAAPASGDGKTTLTTGLLQALVGRGLTPAAFKCGPDYIDPMFHREVLGVTGGNLDLYFTSPDTVRGLLRRGASGSDLAVLEGVMGYYDGVGASDRASGWHVASETATPVVLVIHPKGAFLTLAAAIGGILRFREESMIHGLILNRCGASYAEKLAPMLERETGLQVYGHFPDLPEAMVSSRHLGLTTPDAIEDLRCRIAILADAMENTVDIARLLALAETATELAGTLPPVQPLSGAPVRIAVARDAAFCFYYRENLDLLRGFGAELAYFSPLEDSRLPEGIHGLYLGGGYPELHAGRLSANSGMRRGIRDAIASGVPTVAECGGFLYLQTALADPAGREYPMVGLLEGMGRNTGRLRRFGYLGMRSVHGHLLGDAGQEMKAHEFHYWDTEAGGESFVASKAAGGAPWTCVQASATLYAGFPHLYFWSDPEMARRFVLAAIRRRENACPNPGESR